MVGLLIRLFNCTPLEARRELRHNPDIHKVMAAELYRLAFVDIKRWDDMTPKQRKGQEEPSGYWVNMVRRQQLRTHREAFAERKTALEEAGRV